MVLSIVLCNFKKIILNLKHLKVCDYIWHFFPCVFTIFLEPKTTTKPQFRSHIFFFLIVPYNIPEPMNTSAMSWNSYVVGWSPCSNSHWWIRNHLSFLHPQNIPLFPITYFLVPSQPFTATIGLVPLYSGLPWWLRW